MANDIVVVDAITAKILEARGRRVMLDRDLAMLYGVPVKVLNQAVKRNLKRFPSDFMYQLTRQEVTNLKSQFVTSSWGGVRKPPYVFTQEGIAMLSGVLNSARAIKVNILIMRAFVKLRRLLLSHKELAIKLEALEKKYTNHDMKIREIFEAIRQLMIPAEEPKRRIGFHA